MALDYALAHPKTLLGVVASGPAHQSPPPPGAKLLLGKLVGAVAPTAGFPDGLRAEDLSRDPEVVALRKADPLVHDRITPRTYFAMLDARKRVMDLARRLAVPALLQHGAADKVIDPKGALAFNAGAAARPRAAADLPRRVPRDLQRPGARPRRSRTWWAGSTRSWWCEGGGAGRGLRLVEARGADAPDSCQGRERRLSDNPSPTSITASSTRFT